jgi:predicted DNA-binding transcriptional regulator AlpA
MPYKPAPIESLPPELGLPPATIQQVMAFTGASARTVWRKTRDGTYRSFKDGDRRLIPWSSVIEERDRLIALGAQLPQRLATGKRHVGRPKKTTL